MNHNDCLWQPSILRDVIGLFIEHQAHAVCGSDSTAECRVLSVIAHNGTSTVQEISRALAVDKGWVSRVAGQLESAGQIRRTLSKRDRRHATLSLTDAGAQTWAQLDAPLRAHATGILKDMTPSAIRSLRQLRSKLEPPDRALLRPAEIEDWPAIQRLLRSRDLGIEGAREWLDSFLVATVGGTLSGVVGLEHRGGMALLRSLAVDDGRANLGLGAKLAFRAIYSAHARGAQSLYLLTTTASGYFPRFGFKPIQRDRVPAGIRESIQFKSSCPSTATVMKRSLNS